MEDRHLAVPVAELRQVCDPDQFEFETTEDVSPLQGTVGQDRGIAAIDFGLNVKTRGYNIFVAGLPGSGRNTTVRASVRSCAIGKPTPGDWCYVHNFAEPHRPRALHLPSGTAHKFAADVEAFIRYCQRDIPKAFDGEEYETKKKTVVRELQAARDALSHELQALAAKRGFAIESTQMGIVTVPLREGQPLSREQFDALPADAKAQIQENGEALQEEIAQTILRGRKLEKEVAETVANLDREIALSAVGHLVEELVRRYADLPFVVEYLQDIQNDVLDHLGDFRPADRPADGLHVADPPDEDRFARYRVNVLFSNAGPGAPVVVEHNPTYYNLFGRVDYRARLGTMTADFGTIKPGAIHRANGGYLIIQARDLLLSPFAWDGLKRALSSHEACIENVGEQMAVWPAATLRPAPIPLDLKVILVGHPTLYYTLYHQDEDFRKLFKVKADFVTDMQRTPEHVAKYAAFISSRCRKVGLRHFHRTAVAKVVEYGSRQLEHKAKLSTLFMDIADLVDEASFWCEKEAASYVMARHVDQAVSQKVYRSNAIEQRLEEVIEDGTIMIDTDGAVVGQVNGLAVLDMGDYSFGKPSRITARTFLGNRGIVNIEREARMSGRIHNKGVMILSAYLAGKYAQDQPLSLSASLTFEQLYEDVDGDSASSAELYALVSSLSGLPITQSLAVTGSINQRGEIQAIGGVTRKIEGFFAVCKARGLTGNQGVIIPQSNVKHLMLDEEVVSAVQAGKFAIYAVRTVDEGLALLTGVPVGELSPDGSYASGTVHALAMKQLSRNVEKLRKFGQGERTKDGPEGTSSKEED